MKTKTSTISKVKKESSDFAKKALSKTAMAVKKVGNSAVKNPTTTLYVAGGILALALGYKLYKTASKAGDKITDVLDGDPNIDNDVEGSGSGQILYPTINEQQALNFAQQLLDAMNVKRPVYGTDKATIKAVFLKLLNGDDYLMVYSAFGKKDYNGYNSPPEGFFSNFDSYEKRDLNYWLNSEISKYWDSDVYKIIKKRIESTNIFVFSQ